LRLGILATSFLEVVLINILKVRSNRAVAATMSTSMTPEAMQRSLERLLLHREIEEFVAMEAELLDERRYNDWLQLIADDIHYFVPIRRNMRFGEQEREESSADSEISWMDEGKRILVGRVKQIMTGIHWCEEPLSRVRHVISNVQIVAVRGDEVEERDRFIVYRNRLQDEWDLFAGKREQVFRRDSETGWKIAKRTVILDQNVLLAKNITFFF
jgi:biphenyl 2,3-dioxygenase subunit beta